MYKAVAVLFLCVAVANAGLLGSPIAYSAPVLAAPVAHVAPVAIKTAIPVATSYQNTYKISSGAVPVVAAAPVIKAAPISYAAPVIKAPIVAAPAISYAAPAISYAAAPALVKSPLFASPLSYGHY